MAKPIRPERQESGRALHQDGDGMERKAEDHLYGRNFHPAPLRRPERGIQPTVLPTLHPLRTDKRQRNVGQRGTSGYQHLPHHGSGGHAAYA